MLSKSNQNRDNWEKTEIIIYVVFQAWESEEVDICEAFVQQFWNVIGYIC